MPWYRRARATIVREPMPTQGGASRERQCCVSKSPLWFGLPCPARFDLREPAISLSGVGEAVFVTAGLSVSPASGVYESSLTFTGTAFAPHENVQFTPTELAVGYWPALRQMAAARSLPRLVCHCRLTPCGSSSGWPEQRKAGSGQFLDESPADAATECRRGRQHDDGNRAWIWLVSNGQGLLEHPKNSSRDGHGQCVRHFLRQRGPHVRGSRWRAAWSQQGLWVGESTESIIGGKAIGVGSFTVQ